MADETIVPGTGTAVVVRAKVGSRPETVADLFVDHVTIVAWKIRSGSSSPEPILIDASDLDIAFIVIPDHGRFRYPKGSYGALQEVLDDALEHYQKLWDRKIAAAADRGRGVIDPRTAVDPAGVLRRGRELQEPRPGERFRFKAPP